VIRICVVLLHKLQFYLGLGYPFSYTQNVQFQNGFMHVVKSAVWVSGVNWEGLGVG